MSVIFQTLKKLHNQPLRPEVAKLKKRAKRKPIGFRTLLQTPLGMGLFIGAIFALGFVSLYLLERLSGGQRNQYKITDKVLTENTSNEHLDPLQKNEDSSLSAENNGRIPPMSEEIELVDDAMPTYYPVNTEKDIPLRVSSVSADISSVEPTDTNTATNPVDVDAAVIKERDILGPVSFTPALTSQTLPEKENLIDGNNLPFSRAQQPQSFGHENEQTIPLNSVMATGGSDSDLLLPVKKTQSGPSQNIEYKENKSIVTPTLEPRLQEHLANLEKFQRAAKKRADIARLVNRLESAIELMDKAQVDNLFNRLMGIKGEDNPYVLNLRAYWYLKQNRLSEAEVLLLKILEKDADQLDAGLNLAIVEVRTQRKTAAIKRLRRLQEFYPENTFIADMIRKLL
ncbi:MAG: hypothetical protein PVI90_11390 [Desulfobacteraceae bacterium]|jgi:hypothetical protein